MRKGGMLMNTFKVPEHLAHMVKSAYKAADGTYMIDLNVGYRSEYGTNWVQADTKKQAIYELENFVYEVDKDEWMEEFGDSANTLYEESIQELRNKIIRLKGQRYLDGIDKRSNGHAGYYALSKILHNLEQKQKENSVKSGENNVNNVQLQFDFKENYKITRTDKQYLVEATMKQLKSKTLSQDPTRAKKSKNVQSRYLGISKYGVLNFETTSETHAGVKWYQEIHFPSFDGFMNIVEGGDRIEPDDVKRVMMSDNLKISCDDPSFLYWCWKYMAWMDVYGLEKETRAPKRNNTRLQGALCKHLYSVFDLLSNSSVVKSITDDLNEFCLQKLGQENKGYQSSDMMNKDFKANQYDWNIEDVYKDVLTKEQYNKYMDGTPIDELDLTDEQYNKIDEYISKARKAGDYALKTELEKQFAPNKRGRAITRPDKKLGVNTGRNIESEVEQ